MIQMATAAWPFLAAGVVSRLLISFLPICWQVQHLALKLGIVTGRDLAQAWYAAATLLFRTSILRAQSFRCRCLVLQSRPLFQARRLRSLADMYDAMLSWQSRFVHADLVL